MKKRLQLETAHAKELLNMPIGNFVEQLPKTIYCPMRMWTTFFDYPNDKWDNFTVGELIYFAIIDTKWLLSQRNIGLKTVSDIQNMLCEGMRYLNAKAMS